MKSWSLLRPQRVLPLLLPALSACTYITEEEIARREDLDGDGYPVGEDCDSEDASVGPPLDWYVDEDGDGYGGETVLSTGCEGPDGGTSSAGDCDDTNLDVAPGKQEICGDAVVNDCLGSQEGAWLACGWNGKEDAATTGVRLLGESEADLAGSAILAPGDIDGDGEQDLVLSAPGAALYRGRIYLLKGPFETFTTLDDLGLRIQGETAGDLAGYATASLGDIDGDGTGDLGVGAPARGASELDLCRTGTAYIVLGVPSLDDLGGADGRFSGAYERACTGHAISAAGDLDTDGYGDLIVGSPALAGGIGRAWVLPGSALEGATLEEDAVGLTGEVGSMLGYDVHGGDDLDGDGLPELLLGAPGGDDETPTLFIVAGAEPAALSLDDAVALTAGLSTVMFGSSVLVFGDNDGDGLSDVAVAARADETERSSAGAFFVLNSPPPTASDSVVAVADAEVYGEEAGGALGFSLAAAGDADRNGHDDLVVGIPGSDLLETDSGAALLALAPLAGILDVSDAGPQVSVAQQNLNLGVAVGSFEDPRGTTLILGAPTGEGEVAEADQGITWIVRVPTW